MEKPVNLPVPANSNLPPGLPSHLNIVPSEAEAESAISGLRSFLDTEDGLEFGSSPLMPYPADYQGMHQPTLQTTVRADLQLLETDPAAQSLVTSIATNEAVWRAIASAISEVQNFSRPPKTETMSSNVQTPVISNCYQHQSSGKASESKTKIKIVETDRENHPGKLEIYKVIVGETVWKVIELIMENVFGKDKNLEESREENSPVGGSRRREENQSVDESKEEKLLLSVILATVVVLVVIVLRFYVPLF